MCKQHLFIKNKKKKIYAFCSYFVGTSVIYRLNYERSEIQELISLYEPFITKKKKKICKYISIRIRNVKRKKHFCLDLRYQLNS